MVIQTSDLTSFLNSDLVSGLANVSQFYISRVGTIRIYAYGD